MRQEALLKDPLGEGFQDAIRLFRGLGSAAAPVARELQQQNRANVTRRLQSLALAVLTEEEPEDLVGLLKGASVEERMMAFLVLAGLEEDGTEILLPLLQGKDRVLPLRLTVAALAAATHGTPVDRAVDAYRDDPGVVAAGQLSGSAVDCDLRPWLADEPRRRPHSDLVLRGAFLGHIEPGKQVPDLVLGAARKAFESPATVDAVREAAALLLGAKGWIPAPPGSTPPPPALLWHCAGAADEERMALLREWLGSKPSALYEYPGRLAVCHALSRLVPDAKDTRSTWIHTVGADDIALTFALRVLWWDEDPAQVIDVGCVEAGGLVDLARITDTADHPACLSWLAWAAGATASPRSDSGNPRLDAAAALAAEGRLPRTVAARILEDALWTRGNHPRLAVREARLQLVRDLLLSGSNPGLRYASAVPLHERYVVRDLPRDAPWFEVAVEVWDALSPPGLPMPARHRLR